MFLVARHVSVILLELIKQMYCLIIHYIPTNLLSSLLFWKHFLDIIPLYKWCHLQDLLLFRHVAFFTIVVAAATLTVSCTPPATD